jgi:hypothetical protein
VFAAAADGKLQRVFVAWAIREFSLFTVPAMQAFLLARHLQAEASWLVDRYVRVVDQARKHEVIFFYLEAASTKPPGIHYGGAPSEPPPPPSPPSGVERELLRRAGAAFQVSEP